MTKVTSYGSAALLQCSCPVRAEEMPRPSDVMNRNGQMSQIDIGKMLLGVAVWIAVAVISVVVVANVENTYLGLGAVTVAVLAAWAIGERVVRSEGSR